MSANSTYRKYRSMLCGLLSAFLLSIPAADAQLTLSGTGYTVSITVTPTSVILGSGVPPCTFGYGYRIGFSYSIVVTGTIPMGGALNTSQGYFSCNSNATSGLPAGLQYFDLPNIAGSGTDVSSNDYTNYTNCATVTPATLDCINTNSLRLEIQGPGITGGTSINGTGTGDFFFVTPGGTALPVRLSSFEGRKHGNSVLLTWITASEAQNQSFTLERSANTVQWKSLSAAAGAGTTSLQHTYRHTDTDPLPGMNFYRLKQTDHDGAVRYSQIVGVQTSADVSDVSVYPNPSKTGDIHIAGLATPAEWQMTIINAALQQVLNTRLVGADVSLPQMPSGMYFIRLVNKAANERRVIKFIRE